MRYDSVTIWEVQLVPRLLCVRCKCSIASCGSDQGICVPALEGHGTPSVRAAKRTRVGSMAAATRFKAARCRALVFAWRRGSIQ